MGYCVVLEWADLNVLQRAAGSGERPFRRHGSRLAVKHQAVEQR
jgi:hypothetical protein